MSLLTAHQKHLKNLKPKSMNDFKITVLESQTLVADSREIAKELGIDHQNLIQTVRTHQTAIETNFGVCLFETDKPLKGSLGGKPTIYCLLTEDQFIFIVTLSRNTVKVVQVKARLVKAFSLAKQALKELSTNAINHTRSAPTPTSTPVDAMVDEFILTAIDGLSNCDSIEDLDRVSANLLGFVTGYKEVKYKENQLKRFMSDCSSESLARAALKDGLAKVANQWLEPHLALCKKKSKSRLPNRNRLPISFTEFNRECLANGVTIPNFTELARIMSELGFEREQTDGNTCWVFIH